MQSRHQEVERVEHRGAGDLHFLERVVLPRQRALVEVGRVLDRLDPEEPEREQDGEREADHGSATLIGAGEVDGERDREAGSDQHDRVHRARGEVQVAAALRERQGELEAIHGVAGKQTGEEEDLGGEEEPHPQPHRLVLPLQRGEVMREDSLGQAGSLMRHG